MSIPPFLIWFHGITGEKDAQPISFNGFRNDRLRFTALSFSAIYGTISLRKTRF